MVENSRDQAGVDNNQSVGQPEETGFPNTQKKTNTSTGPGQEDQLQGGSGSTTDPQKTERHNFKQAGSTSTGGFDSMEKEELDEIDEFRKENNRETK
ncbi:MAG TPA: hypothetical protein VM012_00680 [Flavitalea sp.]|nr:hypothetical protein [Flavitalea sp.]